MIGRLWGILRAKESPFLLIDVNGVGYEVETSLNTQLQCPEVGQSLSLYTHFVVREDAQLLYGFYDETERRLFRSLIKVNGVGPKLAISILSNIEPSDFVLHVKNQDTARLTQIPGIGKKTAERLIVEMRDRLSDWIFTAEQQSSPSHQAGDAIQDAVSALIALGYKPQQASRMVSAVDSTGKASDAIIREALKQQALV